MISDLQMVARANLIFGLHVHVGVEDRDDQITIMNQARYFLPHIFALSNRWDSRRWPARPGALRLKRPR